MQSSAPGDGLPRETAAPETAAQGPSLVERARLAVAVGATVILLATVALPQPEPVSWPVLAGLLAAAAVLTVVVARRWAADWMDRWAGVVGVVLLTGLVAATGGAASHYAGLFLLIPVSTAAVRSTRRLLVYGAAAAAGMVLPVVYDPAATSGVWLTELAVDLAVFTAVTAVVHLQGRAIRRHLAALGASEQRFRRIADHSMEGRYELHLEPVLEFVYVNRALEAMTGFTADDYRADGGLRADRVHPDDTVQLDVLQAGWGDPAAPPVELRWRHADGHWLWVAARETATTNSDGRTVVEGSLQDISAHKRLEQSLRETLEKEQSAAERLRELDRIKNTFLSALSHELRTPLTAILGYAHTLVDRRGVLDEAQTKLLNRRLLTRAEHLDELLNDLLDVDRLSRDAMTIERTPTDLLALARRVVDGYNTNHHRVHVHGSEVTAAVDAPKIERVIENLLANAVRHTPPGTDVHIHLSGTSDTVLLEVEDNGPGIPAGLREAVFEPFRQSETAANEPSPGTGIGLSLVAQFARLHQGRAWVSERPGGGAIFHVELPTRTPAPSLAP